jgi:thioredoxin-disulfide reductase
MYDVIIVGSGPAGLSAAIYSCRKKLKTTLISLDIGGQGNLTSHIENYPGVMPTSGIKLMEIFQKQAESFGAEFIFGKVVNVKKVSDYFEVELDNKEKYLSQTVILSFGKIARRLGIPGEDKFFGKGVSTCATCDGPLFKGKNVAVIGGGNSALEASMDLSNFAKKVYLVHRRNEFRGDEVTVEKVKKNPIIEIILDTAPIEIKGEKFVKSLFLENINNLVKKEIFVDAVFLEIGYVVDPSLVKNLVKINKNNEIEIDHVGRTSCQGIFAAGDATNNPYKQAVIAAGDGARAALQAYNYLVCEKVKGSDEKCKPVGYAK